MKKSIYLVVAAFAMLTTFVSCASKPAETKPAEPKPVEKLPVTVEATDNGIELKLDIPAGITNVQIFRKDVDSNFEFVCGMVNFPSATSGGNKTYIDYFVEPNKTYAYTVRFVKNWNWNESKYYNAEVVKGYAGKGEFTPFEKIPTYDASANSFVGMKLKNIGLDGFNSFTNVNAYRNDKKVWLVDDGGYNIYTMGDGTYFGISYLLDKLEANVEDITIQVGSGANKEDNGCWIIYNGIPAVYTNGVWN